MCGFNILVCESLEHERDIGTFPIFKKDILKHRGPDSHTEKVIELKDVTVFMTFDRLSIIDIEGGTQPITKGEQLTMVCNGEIYNYKHLRDICKFHNIQSEGSDCEVIASLFIYYVTRTANSFDAFKNVIKMLDGDFAIALLYNSNLYVARDPIGVRPMFYYINESVINIASELKGCHEEAIQLKPGYIGNFNIKKHMVELMPYIELNDGFIHDDTTFIKPMLIESVKKRLMSERPLAYFLSGGLDSSIIASIGQSLSTTPIKTFSIGMEGSTDLIYARQMAEYLKSDHTEVKLDVDECIKTLETLIYHLESYDCTTVRASMPMFMLSRYVATQTPYRVVISGEGSDELFGGYLFFHNAPNNQAFQNETDRLIKELPYFDVLRGDRSTAAHGLEIRVPFLDKEFVKKVLTLRTFHKRPNNFIHVYNRSGISLGETKMIYESENPRGIEKFILREKFEDMLPDTIYKRQKEAFSDGVGYTWVTRLKQYAAEKVSDLRFQCASLEYPNNTPLSKEEYLYRSIFEKLFPNRHDVIPHMWRPRWTTVTDPSATLLSVHENKNNVTIAPSNTVDTPVSNTSNTSNTSNSTNGTYAATAPIIGQILTTTGTSYNVKTTQYDTP
jgi:asparagine synthase (glutamine-hydrolysing)